MNNSEDDNITNNEVSKAKEPKVKKAKEPKVKKAKEPKVKKVKEPKVKKVKEPKVKKPKVKKPKVKKAKEPKVKKAKKDSAIENMNLKVKPLPKRRGRKPIGGKLLQSPPSPNIILLKRPSIILHLRCSSADIISNGKGDDPYFLDIENIHTSTRCNEIKEPYNNDIVQKNVWDKIKILKKQLHSNDISGKRSNCFWCTYPFDNPPIYIPRQERNGIIEVYGCFCSPECAVAHLKKEPIDTSILWERYSMLNNVYSGIYNYTNNIKPAPCPYYTLDKYYGNLSIQEYRKLLNNQQLLLIVEKPLTKIMPDLYEENNDTPNIYNNLLTEQNKVQLRLKRSITTSSKKNVVASKFMLS